MANTSAKITAFSAVFTVKDVPKAIEFYVEKLGFKIDFQVGEPVWYAAVERDALSLNLMSEKQSPKTLGLSNVYAFTDNVDALHQDLLARGAPIERAPQDEFYGMREMSVRDPDGNRLNFGHPTALQN